MTQLHTHPSFTAADAARALVAYDGVLRLDQTQLLNDGSHISANVLEMRNVVKREAMR